MRYDEQTFHDIKLREETLEDMEFVECEFIGCALDDCVLMRTSFRECRFERCTVISPRSKYSYVRGL